MTLQDYTSIIGKSVAEVGYDFFRPSACIAGDKKDAFHVLECELGPAGEEQAALSWVESLPNSSGTVFLAFRGGERRVAVVEFKNREFVDGILIQVSPYSER